MSSVGAGTGMGVIVNRCPCLGRSLCVDRCICVCINRCLGSVRELSNGELSNGGNGRKISAWGRGRADV